jgi:glycosyltransferase involved in cell wall biosynthesis
VSPNDLPTVSVVMPCRNEEGCLSECLDSIIGSDFEVSRLEIIVVDGMSEDSTRGILQAYADQCSFLKVLDNPKQEQTTALNIGIQAARGDIIVRMDAHSRYRRNYISECVKALICYPAGNVGGRWVTVPREDTLIGRSICFATSSLFGVGNAYYRLTRLISTRPFVEEPRWDINVAYFCCFRDVFDKIGLLNEDLEFSEDIDFREKMRKNGYRTLFVPSIECEYMMRSRLGEFMRHMFRNGKWVLMPLRYSPNISFSVRHIVPLMFVMTIGIIAAISFVSFYPALIVAGIYMLASLVYSFGTAWKEKDARYLLTMPLVFLSLHVTYGIGSIVGLWQLFLGKVQDAGHEAD